MSPIERELLMRYLRGQTNPDEQSRVEAWLAEDPARWAQVADLRDELAGSALSDSALQQAKAEVWMRLRQELPDAGEPNLVRTPSTHKRVFAPSLWRHRGPSRLAAAVIVAVLGGVALGVLLLRYPAAKPSVAVRVTATAPGQRATLRLPDGTRVMLGVASKLRYPPRFSSESREVALEGEAYFEVVHEPGRPFTVSASDLVATDLGTEFTVRAYPDEGGARVVVRGGRVAIRAASPGSPEEVVAPGQLGRLGRDRRPTVEAADTAIWFAWTQGRLILDGAPLRDALPQLSRWFDLDFRLADSSLGDVPLTATLRTQPTEEILNNLAASLGLRQRRTGRIVTLYSVQPSH